MAAEGSTEVEATVGMDSKDAKNSVKTTAPGQIDKGWSWVIVAAGTTIIILYAGVFKSFGIFFIEILAAYKGSVSVTSLMSSLQFVMYCLTAVPVLTFAIQRHSIRTCQFVGATFSAIGFGLSSVVPSLELLILCQSVLCDLPGVPIPIVTYQNVAGVACEAGDAFFSGALDLASSWFGGIGSGFIYPTIIVLIKQYFNRHLGLATGIIMSGYSLGGFCMPALIRYLIDEYGIHGALLLTAGVLLNTMVPAGLLRPVSFYTKTFENVQNNLDTKLQHHPSFESLHENQCKTSTESSIHDYSTNDKKTEDQKTELNVKKQHVTKTTKRDFPLKHTLKPLLHETECIEADTYNQAEMSCADFHNLDILESVSESSIVRYLNSGELIAMSKLDVRWTESNVNIDIEEKPIRIIKNTTLLLRSCTILDKRIWRNKLILIILCVYTFGSVGPESCHIFIPAFAKDENLSDNSVAIVISVLSISDFFGRILSGYVSDRDWIKRYQVILISQFSLATLTAFTYFLKTKITIVVFAVLYGLFAGMIFAIIPSILVQILEQDLFSTGIAVTILIKGSAMGMAIPLMGYLRDVTGTYHASFYFMGACSAVVVMFLLIFNVVSKKQNENNEIDMEIDIDQ